MIFREHSGERFLELHGISQRIYHGSDDLSAFFNVSRWFRSRSDSAQLAAEEYFLVLSLHATSTSGEN